jgi:uracil-DNA glycosylase family 4
MPLDPQLRRALTDRVRFYNELGIYDFYRRAPLAAAPDPTLDPQRESMSARRATAPKPLEAIRLEVPAAHPECAAPDSATALQIIREDLGDCTRCKLSLHRKKIVFGVGNPKADLMFVGEGPGADEDETGEPFVGRAGQLLNNMIKAMGLRREQIYIANVVKCRPPGNRTPEPDECETCSPFLMRQIAAIQPKVVVALGATAAKNLLAMNSSLGDLRGRWFDFKPFNAPGNDPAWPGARLAVTYHPAYLLRDPRQKVEAWKDLQMVMKYLGLEPPPKEAQ